MPATMVAAAACAPDTLVPPLVVPVSTAPQATTSNLQVCGFPEQQLDTSRVGPPSYLTAQGRLRFGRVIPLELRGDSSTLQVSSWLVDPKFNQTRTHVEFVSTSRSGANLVGVRLSADESDYSFAYARAVFRDGTSRNLVVLVCTDTGWRPADQMVVVPQ